jgi:hypothetical protein
VDAVAGILKLAPDGARHKALTDNRIMQTARRSVRLFLGVSWPWVYLQTMIWMRDNRPGSILFAPIAFPVIFALKFRQQYLVGKALASLEDFSRMAEKLLALRATTEKR